MSRRRALSSVVALLILAPPSGAVADPGPAAPVWTPNGPVAAVVVDGSTAYIGGEFSQIGPYTGGSAAFDLDTGEQRAPWPDVVGSVHAAAPDGEGGWYLGGRFSTVGGEARKNLAHVLPGGTLDPDWAPSADGDVNALTVHGSTVFAGGDFRSVSGVTRLRLVAIDGRTGRVTPLAPAIEGGSAAVEALEVAGTKEEPVLYVGGNFQTVGGVGRQHLAAVRISDGFVLGFDATTSGGVLDLEVAGGLVYVVGSFTKVNGAEPRDSAAAFGATDGTLSSWNPRLSAGGGPSVQALDVVGSNVYMVGRIGRVNKGLPSEKVRIGAAAVDRVTGIATAWNPGLSGPAPDGTELAVSGDTAYIAGTFHAVGGTPHDHLVAVTADTGAVIDGAPTAPNPVHAVEVDGESVVFGGDFRSMGGVTRRGLAAIDLTTGRPTEFDPQVLGTVYALALEDGVLWTGGNFSSVGGKTRPFLAAIDPDSGAVGSFSAGLDGAVYALAADGPTVYAGGRFEHVGQIRRNRLAVFSDLPGSAGALLDLDADANEAILALRLDHGRLYLGGRFTTLGGGTVPRRHLAAIDPGSGVPADWDPSPDQPVAAITTIGDTVYAGGTFTRVGTVDRRGLAAIDRGGAPTSFDPVVEGSVSALASDGKQLFAGGTFARAGGAERSSLVAFDIAGGAIAPWAQAVFPGIGAIPPTVHALAVAPNRWLVAGGQFALGGGPQRSARTAVFPLPPEPVEPGPPGPPEPARPGGAGSTAPGSGTALRDTTPPVLTRVRVRPGRITTGGAARLSFTSTEAATLSVTFERRVPGRRTSGARSTCRPVKKRPRRRACTAHRRAGSLKSRAIRAGAGRLTVNERIGRKTLAAGTYRLTLTATDAAGNRSKPVRVQLTITRAARHTRAHTPASEDRSRLPVEEN